MPQIITLKFGLHTSRELVCDATTNYAGCEFWITVGNEHQGFRQLLKNSRYILSVDEDDSLTDVFTKLTYTTNQLAHWQERLKKAAPAIVVIDEWQRGHDGWNMIVFDEQFVDSADDYKVCCEMVQRYKQDQHLLINDIRKQLNTPGVSVAGEMVA